MECKLDKFRVVLYDVVVEKVYSSYVSPLRDHVSSNMIWSRGHVAI